MVLEGGAAPPWKFDSSARVQTRLLSAGDSCAQEVLQSFLEMTREGLLIFKQTYKYIATPDGLVFKTKIKDWTKLAVEMCSQKLNRMTSCVFRIRQKF